MDLGNRRGIDAVRALGNVSFTVLSGSLNKESRSEARTEIWFLRGRA
jgi:hypothetical protein